MASQGIKIAIKNGIKTPCVNVCKMDESLGFCKGCCRTLGEIAQWGSWNDAQRDRVLETLPSRHVIMKSAQSEEKGK